jgi:hypothetical protein
MNRLLAVQLDHGNCKAKFFRDIGKNEQGKNAVSLAEYSVPRYMLLELEETLLQDYGLIRLGVGNVMHCNMAVDGLPEGLLDYLIWY